MSIELGGIVCISENKVFPLGRHWLDKENKHEVMSISIFLNFDNVCLICLIYCCFTYSLTLKGCLILFMLLSLSI